MWGPRLKVTADLYIHAHMCVIVFQRLNAVKTLPGCVLNTPGEKEGWAGVAGWWYVGHSLHASPAPLVRVDSSWGELGESSEVIGVQSGKKK